MVASYLKKLVSFTFFVVLAGYLQAVRSDADSADKTRQLEELRSQIQILQNNLEQTRDKRDQERSRLRTIEQKMGKLHKQIRELNQNLATETSRLSNLKVREKRTLLELQQQSDSLHIQIRAAYTMGRQEYLKILLSQQNPSDISRVLTYYRYLNQARNQRIHKVEKSLKNLGAVRKQISTRAQALQLLGEKRKARQQKLRLARADHHKILVSLDRQVRDQAKELSRLKKDERRLGSLVNRLQDLMADIPPPVNLEARFGGQKGRLKLPVRGKITANFGSPRQLGDLRWKGVFVASKTGAPVNAIFRGRVAYADWLRGFGLLLIIDHGDGFMTLYGHNQSLYKEVGDWVKTGQVIAGSGNTGNPPQPGVYFEVRHNGKPSDPLKWCKRR